MPTLNGIVVEKWSGVPIANAVVVVNGAQVLTDGAGGFSVDVGDFQAQIQVLHVNYETATGTVALQAAGLTTVRIELKPIFKAFG